MTPSNPYAPPESSFDPGDRPPRRRPQATLLRAAAVVCGFGLLASPSRPAPNVAMRQGQVAAKVCGGILLVGAFFPLGIPGKRSGVVSSPIDDL